MPPMTLNLTLQSNFQFKEGRPIGELFLVLSTLIYHFKVNSFCFSINHHHLHVVPPARISLILSRHFSLSFIASGRSSGLDPVSSHNCCMYVRAGRPAFAWAYAGVHRSTSLMSSSLLLQQCPACLVRLTCIVFVMGSKWSYSLVSCGVLTPGLVQYCSQHSCVVAVKYLLQPFS